jgi:ADP-ribose pyrophosphatase YjhB (NUDIX family)
VFYPNTAAATACIINTGETFMFTVRGKEPAQGKLALPGGFVNPGEGAIDGLRRECMEEIGWDPGPGILFFASFPNVYPYQNISYNTCDLFFTMSAPGLTEQDLRLDPQEIRGVRFVKPMEINFDEFAFDSTRRAVKALLDRR